MNRGTRAARGLRLDRSLQAAYELLAGRSLHRYQGRLRPAKSHVRPAEGDRSATFAAARNGVALGQGSGALAPEQGEVGKAEQREAGSRQAGARRAERASYGGGGEASGASELRRRGERSERATGGEASGASELRAARRAERASYGRRGERSERATGGEASGASELRAARRAERASYGRRGERSERATGGEASEASELRGRKGERSERAAASYAKRAAAPWASMRRTSSLIRRLPPASRAFHSTPKPFWPPG